MITAENIIVTWQSYIIKALTNCIPFCAIPLQLVYTTTTGFSALHNLSIPRNLEMQTIGLADLILLCNIFSFISAI